MENNEHRLTALETRMDSAEKLLSSSSLAISAAIELINKQTLQMEIVWDIMRVGIGAVMLAVLGLVLSSAFGKPVNLTH